MKKLLALLLVALLSISALTLVACFPDDQQPVVYDLEAAKEFLIGYFEDESTVTPDDYTVPAQLPVGDYTYQVTWTSDREDITITVENGMAKIDLNEKTPEEITYTLTATIADGDGKTVTYSRTCTIPKYEVLSFEDYMAAEKGATVTVEGIVVAMNGKSVGNSRNHLFLADVEGKGGYYCYQLDDDPVAAGVEVGMTVAVTATVEPYSGMQETKGGTFKIVSEEKTTVEPKDITAAFANGESLKNYVGLEVTIKGVTVGRQNLETVNSQYLYFAIGEEEGYVRTYITDFPTTLEIVTNEDKTVTSPDKTTIDEAHAAKFGWTANVSGILVLYNSAPYLIPTGTDCFEYLEYVEKTAEEKIAAEKESVTLPSAITADGVIELPLVATYYDDVKYAWAVDNTNFTIGEDGKVSITLGSDALTLKFTLTLTVGEGDNAVVETVVYTVEVAANLVMSETRPYVPAINQVKADKVLYLDGGVSGRYLTTTTDVANAVDVYAEKVTGGYKFYILVDDVKQYITIYSNADGKDSVKYDAEGTCVFTYNPVVNAYVTVFNNIEYYLGTYNTFETISASKLSYINAENTGVEQFPLELLAAKP